MRRKGGIQPTAIKKQNQGMMVKLNGNEEVDDDKESINLNHSLISKQLMP